VKNNKKIRRYDARKPRRLMARFVSQARLSAWDEDCWLRLMGMTPQEWFLFKVRIDKGDIWEACRTGGGSVAKFVVSVNLAVLAHHRWSYRYPENFVSY
jgi:predicted Rdx family selenoprotein